MCVLSAARALEAQADTVHATRGLWIAGSLGAAGTRSLIYEGEPSVGVGLDLQRGPWLASVRRQAVGVGLGTFELRALSLLGGRATESRGVWYSSLAIGVSGVEERLCTAGCGLLSDTDTPRTLGPAQWGIGVVLAGDAALRFGHVGGAGFGLTGYANLNTAKSFAGVGLELLVGRWR